MCQTHPTGDLTTKAKLCYGSLAIASLNIDYVGQKSQVKEAGIICSIEPNKEELIQNTPYQSGKVSTNLKVQIYGLLNFETLSTAKSNEDEGGR